MAIDEQRDATQALHRAWTYCAGKPGYNKAAWMAVEAQVEAIIAAENNRATELARMAVGAVVRVLLADFSPAEADRS